MKKLTLVLFFLPSLLLAQNMTDSMARNKYMPLIHGGFGFSFRNLDNLENTFQALNIPNVGPQGFSISSGFMQNPYYNSAVSLLGFTMTQWEGNTNNYYARFRATSWYLGVGVRAWHKGRWLLMPSLQFGAQGFQIMIDEFENQSTMKLSDFLSTQSPTNNASTTSKVMLGVGTSLYYKLGQTFTLSLRPYYQYRMGKTQWEGYMGRNLEGPKMNRHLLACEIGFVMVWN